MAQLYRDQFVTWVDVSTKTRDASTTPNYVKEGQGLESLSITFNSQKSTFKTILKRTSDTTFDSYQMSSSVSGKRLYSDDPMYEYVNDLRMHAIAGETTLVEVNTAKKGVAGAYEAVKYDVLITVNEWLGENATISYDYDYSNPVVGTATISNGTITFVPEASED